MESCTSGLALGGWQGKWWSLLSCITAAQSTGTDRSLDWIVDSTFSLSDGNCIVKASTTNEQKLFKGLNSGKKYFNSLFFRIKISNETDSVGSADWHDDMNHLCKTESRSVWHSSANTKAPSYFNFFILHNLEKRRKIIKWTTNLKNPQIILWSACEGSDRSKHTNTTSVSI